MIPLPRLLDAGMAEVRRLHPTRLSINEDLYALSYANMTLAPGEEIELHSWVELFTPSGSAGIYRVSQAATDYKTGCQELKLEHGICALGDAVADVADTDVTGTVSEVLTRLLQYQVTQAGGADLWAKGTVEPTDGNVTVSLNYTKTLSALTNLLDQLNGCHPVYDQSSLPWTVSIANTAAQPGAEGRISRNIASAKVSVDDRDMVNALYCPKLAGGVMTDSASIAAWGRREGYLKVDDGATAAMVTAACQRYLDKRKEPAIAVSIDMADLSAETGEPLDAIRCGKLFRLALPKYGVTVEQVVNAVSWPDLVADPMRARVSLANHAADLVIKIKNMGKGGGGTKKELEKTIKRFTTSISQTDEYIRLIATETDVQTARTVGQSLFQITSGDITSVVTQAGVSTSDTFSATASYAAGATVVYGGALYRFTAAHSGPWTGNDVTQITLQSQISQNAQAITLAVGDISQLQIDVNGISITGNVITIKGESIDLDGYVTVTALQATDALIADLRSGNASFTMLDAIDVSCDSIVTDGITVNGENPMKAIASFGTATESGGQISIPTTCLDSSSGPPINFNIAATSYYQTQVAAADTAGYNRGVGEFTAVQVRVADTSSGIYLNRYGYDTLYYKDSNGDYHPCISAQSRYWYYNASTDVSTGTYAKYTLTSGYYTRSST